MAPQMHDDVNRMKNEIIDSFDEELELQLEEERIEDLVTEGLSDQRLSARHTFVSFSVFSTNLFDCRTGYNTKS